MIKDFITKATEHGYTKDKFEKAQEALGEECKNFLDLLISLKVKTECIFPHYSADFYNFLRYNTINYNVTFEGRVLTILFEAGRNGDYAIYATRPLPYDMFADLESFKRIVTELQHDYELKEDETKIARQKQVELAERKQLQLLLVRSIKGLT